MDTTMGTTTTNPLADRVLATLRAHEGELRAAGIRRLSLFGSVARGDHEADSDVDLAAEFEPGVELTFGLWDRAEERLAEILGRRVDLVILPVRKPRLRANIERDGRLAFAA